FLSQNAAGGVDVLHRLLDAVLELRAEGGAAAGDRSGDAQLDLRRSVIRKSKAKTEGEAKREPLSHSVHLWMKTRVGRVSRAPSRDSTRKSRKCHSDFGVSAAGVSSRRRQRNGPARSWIHL